MKLGSGQQKKGMGGTKGVELEGTLFIGSRPEGGTQRPLVDI